jgi:hypothetical protein
MVLGWIVSVWRMRRAISCIVFHETVLVTVVAFRPRMRTTKIWFVISLAGVRVSSVWCCGWSHIAFAEVVKARTARLRVAILRAGCCRVVVLFSIILLGTRIWLHVRHCLTRWCGSRGGRHRSSVVHAACVNRKRLSSPDAIGDVLLVPFIGTVGRAHHNAGGTSRRRGECMCSINTGSGTTVLGGHGVWCRWHLASNSSLHRVMMMKRWCLGWWSRRIRAVHTPSVVSGCYHSTCSVRVFWVVQHASDIVHEQWV